MEENLNEKLQILMPVHNEGKSLEETIFKIYEVVKTKINFSFIICEDGSNDDTVEITIADKGFGLDVSEIRKRAVDFYSENEEVNPEEIIFADGFSTSKEVTKSSGRGLGMTAIKTYVGELGGSIKVKTELTAGCTLHIVVPKEMAVKKKA